MNLNEIEIQLKKRLLYPYSWGRKQNDIFDRTTNFIYKIDSFDLLLKEIEKLFSGKDNYNAIFNYALNRWYNFWSAQAVEHIFCTMPNVEPELDKKNRLVDFKIQGVKFDHKTSVFPKGFPKPLNEAYKNTPELIRWLYQNQSKQQRMHLKNRLFIVLYSTEGEHWKLKAEISWLKSVIERYMLGFNVNYLMKFSFEKDKETISDIIWAIK